MSRSALARNAARQDVFLFLGRQPVGKPSGKLPVPHYLFVGRPELGVKDDRLQGLDPVGQLDLEVFLEVETGVLEPRRQDALVSPHDQGDIRGLRIVYRDEAGHDFAPVVHHREVALVGAHGGDHHVLGQDEVLLGDGARRGKRELRQVYDLLDQPRIGQHRAPAGRGDLGHLALDEAAPLVGIDDNERLLELFPVIPGVADRDRLRRVKAVPPGEVTAGDIAEGQRDDLPAEDGHDPVDRPHEADRLVHPAHALLEGDIGDQPGQYLGQHVGRGTALVLSDGRHIFALIGLDPLEVLDGNALPPGKPHGLFVGFSVRPQAYRYRRPDLFDGFGPLAFGHALDDQHEPSGGPQGSDGARVDAIRIQELLAEPPHRRQRRVDKSGRDLFRTNFKQQFFCHNRFRK